MKNFSQIVTEPLYNKKSDTNEIVGILLASACLAYALGPIIKGVGDQISANAKNKESGKDSGGGSGGGFFSWLFGGKKDDKPKDDKPKDDKPKDDKPKDDKPKDDNDDGKKDNEAFNSLLMMARQSNEKEKNANEKAKNDSMIKLLTACSFDKDGNEIPVEERINKMKDTMSPEQFEAFKKDMTETYEKNKDNQDFKDAMIKAKANIKPEDYDKMLDEAKKEAKATLEQLDKEKKEIDEYKQKLDDLEKQMNGEKDKDKLDDLKSQQAELQQNAPTSIIAAVTGVTATGDPATPTGEPEPNKEGDKEPNKEGDKEPNKEGDKEPNKEGDKEPNKEGDKEPNKEGDKEPNKEGDKEPKKKSEEEIKAEHDKIKKEYNEKSDALAKEYQDKIDKETDKDKKEALEKEWEKKESELSADKNKKMDAVDDNDDHDTEKDETKQGKYKVKDEEIEDPKTGKKIKVKTYTGPRGGKFYYPEGSPKTPENKVYVESISLTDYLLESFGK